MFDDGDQIQFIPGKSLYALYREKREENPLLSASYVIRIARLLKTPKTYPFSLRYQKDLSQIAEWETEGFKIIVTVSRITEHIPSTFPRITYREIRDQLKGELSKHDAHLLALEYLHLLADYVVEWLNDKRALISINAVVLLGTEVVATSTTTNFYDQTSRLFLEIIERIGLEAVNRAKKDLNNGEG